MKGPNETGGKLFGSNHFVKMRPDAFDPLPVSLGHDHYCEGTLPLCPESLRRLFSPFLRLSSNPRTPASHRGLFLAISGSHGNADISEG
jgi:hypothetical protein